MASVSTTKSTVFSAALVTAAMALPSLQFAYAEAAPERGVVSFKYLNYQDSQGIVGQSGSSTNVVNALSGASKVASSGMSGTSASGFQDRIGVNAYSVTALVPIAGEWSVGTTYTSDSVSGASPTYHSSGLVKMTDLRRALDVQLTRYFSRGSVSFGTSYSKETDYISRGFNVQGSLSTEDKNTTFTLGGAFNNDSINPVTQPNLDEKKQVAAGLIGVTRVLTPQDIVQLNFGYSKGNGYYSDPYKLNDNRPRDRNSFTALARWNHHFDDNGTDGTVHLSYRYYSDTFGIRAHTFDAEYVQPLYKGWTLTPLLRFYTQNEADFYISVATAEAADPTQPTPPPADAVYYSEDQRLSSFGAITAGLKVSKQINKDWLVDAKYEQYEQRAQWSLSGGGDKGLTPFKARSIQIGVSRQF
ncbi:MAG: DUF3570 domain-containing protein [Chlorobiales bacterium]|nr:DUF3570 domain-containing protein [Chlorobiales bacterium]